MKQPIFALVCAGGGAHGAYQVGVLKYIHEKFSDDKKSPFRVFAGSSCGSLNTSFFAGRSFEAYESRLHLEELWRNFHIPSYHGSMTKNVITSLFRNRKMSNGAGKEKWSLLDPGPMYDVVKVGFRCKDLEKSLKQKTTLGVAVAATELLSARTCWFLDGEAATPWNLFHSVGIKTNLKPEHIMASCSVPVFMPPVKINHRYFLDGSAGLAKPLSAAISMGATKIFSIGTNKPISQDLPSYPEHFKPKLSHVLRMMIDQLARDHATDEAIQIDKLNQFHRSLNKQDSSSKSDGLLIPLYHEEHQVDHYKPIDICTFFPSRKISGSQAFGTYESGPAKRKKTTNFMFHEKFISELINLGYEDASSKHEDLREFFLPKESLSRRWFIFGGNKK